MRILVISEAAWNTSNSFGNTVTNWFDGWNDAHFFHFYARQQKPNTDIVEKYYSVSAIEILKNALKGKQAGRAYDPSEVVDKCSENKPNKEQELITRLHKNSNEIIYWLMEQVWRSRKWINNAFDEFLEEADPDIIFAFATSSYILEPAIRHIKKMNPSVKVVLWIADDILTGNERKKWYRRRYLKRGLDYCLNVADKVYGASIEMCEKYSHIYGKNVTPLYKGCTFDKPVKERNNVPLRLVYAGNLLYGRLETLKEVIKALRKINSERSKAILEIYSNTPIDRGEEKEWFDNLNAFYMGVRSYEEIKGILNESDIVLHVESFEKEQMTEVKFSFSTKIIDCLQSGSAVVGIGPAGIASIEYLKKVDGTLVVDDPNIINEALGNLIDGKKSLIDRARNTREYAIENHEINRVRKKLKQGFEDLIECTR